MWTFKIDSFNEWQRIAEQCADMFADRRQLEADLQEGLGEDDERELEGYCAACAAATIFTFDRLYGNGTDVNWRERLVCRGCGLNNRMRLVCALASESFSPNGSRIYLTEQVTPLTAVISRTFNNVAASEYVSADMSPGAVTDTGIRHEDVTNLSFQAGQFDGLLTFDVLEHVPDYRRALGEFARVLARGGELILTAPFLIGSPTTITRARMLPDGTVEHLLPAEYHGDPLNAEGGILCYYHFGWDLLQDLRDAGFESAYVTLSWSRELAHLGPEQVVIRARKPGQKSRPASLRRWFTHVKGSLKLRA